MPAATTDNTDNEIHRKKLGSGAAAEGKGSQSAKKQTSAVKPDRRRVLEKAAVQRNVIIRLYLSTRARKDTPTKLSREGYHTCLSTSHT